MALESVVLTPAMSVVDMDSIYLTDDVVTDLTSEQLKVVRGCCVFFFEIETHKYYTS